ncbi:MAG: RNA methyltransferase [Erysipelotrichaceae bacterium]|nr:RNA methyltransferase [Erysipelotrichaceae bacterium]
MIVFEGAISVKAAIESSYRVVQEIWMDEKKKSKDFGYILKMAEIKGIPVRRVSKEALQEVAQGHTHGGVIAYVQKRSYASLDTLLQAQQPLFLAFLEGIEDPFNFGYAMRSLYASGCQGVIVPCRNWNEEESIIVKSSAGASEKLPICVVDQYEELILKLQQAQVAIICAMREDAKTMYEVDYNQNILLAIGGPLRGLSHQILQHSTQNVYIPYANDFRNALNASSAISILSYEIYRQRHQIMVK